MQNYLKSEWYRVVRSRELYLLIGILCALAVAMNVLLFTMSLSDSEFPYATVWFSLSNLTANLPNLFIGAGLVVALLFADNKRNGVYKNALTQGISRLQLFFGKTLVCVIAGIVCTVIILLVYSASAVLLLSGPAVEPIQYMLEGVGAALPSTIAVIVLAVAGFTVFNNTTATIVFWIAIVFALPLILGQIAPRVEPVAALASWIPTLFFGNEVHINLSGQHEFLWNTPYGLMKCMVAGFAGLLVFAGFGAWRARKMEL